MEGHFRLDSSLDSSFLNQGPDAQVDTTHELKRTVWYTGNMYDNVYTLCITNVVVVFLPPATKLGKGNILSSVCQEFCSQGE